MGVTSHGGGGLRAPCPSLSAARSSSRQISRNYPANPFPWRADSSFLYFFERPEPGSAALFDPGDKSVTLFLPARSVENALWEGEVPSFDEEKARHGVDAVLPVEELEEHVRRLAKGRQLDALAVADARTTARARAITGQDLDFDDPQRAARPHLLDAIAKLRLVKDERELEIMRHTAEVTKEGHLLAMRYTRPGVTEQLLAGHLEGAFARHGCVPAYGTILSVRGEVLHNHAHHNVLQQGDIVLLDAGAEDQATGYCSDVTRCWPVGGGFTPEGRDVYELVLASQVDAIARVKPGLRYRELHARLLLPPRPRPPDRPRRARPGDLRRPRSLPGRPHPQRAVRPVLPAHGHGPSGGHDLHHRARAVLRARDPQQPHLPRAPRRPGELREGREVPGA
jgi:Xaa-Pro aminopeptidase